METLIKQRLKDAMWTKLKAAQADEISRIETLRFEVQKKKMQESRPAVQSFNPGA